MQLLPLKSGWKTYAACAIGVGLGVANAFGWHEPGWMDWILAFAGLAAARHGIQTQSQRAAEDVALLIADVLGQISLRSPEAAAALPSHINIGGKTIRVGGNTVTLGQPSPAGIDEKAETAALNRAHL